MPDRKPEYKDYELIFRFEDVLVHPEELRSIADSLARSMDAQMPWKVTFVEVKELQT